jgi:hypothetical protein
MRTITFALPILLGKQEAWRRCLQEMLDVYCSDYEAFRRRLGMTKVSVWLTEMPGGNMVIVLIEAEEPETILPKLAESDHAFARWLRQHVLELHGLDITQPTRMVTELVLEGQVP